MTERQVKIAMAIAVSGLIVVKAAHDIKQISSQAKVERVQITEDMHLDIQAIHNAQDVISARIDSGEIRSLDALKDAVRTEVEFSKIAIREDPTD